MSFLGPNTATLGTVASATVSTTIFSAATNVSGRNLYNASTAVCYVAFGTVATTTSYTYQVAANTNSPFAVPTYSGPVTAIWTAANGSAITTQWLQVAMSGPRKCEIGCTCCRHPDGYAGSKEAYHREYQRKYRRMVFRNVLEAYGSRCECCGETEEMFLTVEHLNNDGADHRRKFKGDWVTMMLDIRRQGYPEDYTIRCYNCNSGRQRNGGVCPHKQQW